MLRSGKYHRAVHRRTDDLRISGNYQPSAWYRRGTPDSSIQVPVRTVAVVRSGMHDDLEYHATISQFRTAMDYCNAFDATARYHRLSYPKLSFDHRYSDSAATNPNGGSTIFYPCSACRNSGKYNLKNTVKFR